MIEQTKGTEAVFMEITSQKINGQDKRIAVLEERIKSIPDNTELIKKMVTNIEMLRNEAKANYLPAEKVQDFSARLDVAIGFLKAPVENKVVHEHHIPKLIWITAGLFVAFCLVCSGWYVTSSKLDSYIANDTKYRWLRLDTANRGLQSYLDGVDSLYNVWPDMRKNVLEMEEKNQLNFERLQKAERLKGEARELENKAKER